jgi:outer membrane receptor protein involved in Fe transport
VQELQKSNGVVGPPLQPENGVDYELGGRGSFLNGRLFIDIDAFFFHINNAIVQRIDSNGVSYSVNAGGTNQHGIETFVSYRLVDRPRASAITSACSSAMPGTTSTIPALCRILITIPATGCPVFRRKRS